MKNIFPLLLCFAVAWGCAPAGHSRQNEKALREERRMVETDQRLNSLEQSVATMDRRVTELDSRTYQVVSGSGRNTGMKVVPVPSRQSGPDTAATLGRPAAPQPAPERIPAESAGVSYVIADGVTTTQQVAPILTPSSVPPLSVDGKPPVPAKEGADKANVSPDTASKSDRKSDSASQTPSAPDSQQNSGQSAQKVAGPSGSLGAPSPEAVRAAAPLNTSGVPASPPQPQPVKNSVQRPVASGQPSRAAMPDRVTTTAVARDSDVPMPSLPPADLALPPEQPTLPPAVPVEQGVAATPQVKEAPAPSIPPSNAQNLKRQSAQASLPKPGQNEEAAYKAALKLAMGGRSAEGISQFRDFLQQYPTGRYAANAEYWIGECYYAQNNYKDALVQFQLVNSQYSTHHKNADALLKAGMTLSRMGDKQGAAEKIRSLQAAFPNSEAAKRARDMGLAR